MLKVKWNWLRRHNESYMKSIYDCYWVQAGISFIIMLVLFIPIGAPLDTMTSLPGPVWFAIATLPFFIGTIFWRHLPKLHWLNGLSDYQAEAIEWYDDLSDDEKAQLPIGWDVLVREKGNEKMVVDGYGHFNTVVNVMVNNAEEIIELYRKNNEKPQIPDYRMETYLQLMHERKEDLKLQIRQRKETEKQIALMD